jgi:ABC-type transport system involved in cytochrome bd biosynthesis fused ATPase/permease subunit
VELDGRFADGLDGWISQDMLSLGEAQRLNLARALLSTAPLVLLDEPVEHLHFDQAARILKRVLSRLANRIVIYSSHAEYAVPATVRIPIGTDREIA